MAPTKTLIVTLAIAMYEVGTFCKPDWILAAPRPGRFRVLAQFGWVPARTQKKVLSASIGLLQQDQCSLRFKQRRIMLSRRPWQMITSLICPSRGSTVDRCAA